MLLYGRTSRLATGSASGAAKPDGEAFEGRQGLVADMMLDALGVVFGVGVADAAGPEEIEDDLVPAARPLGQFDTGLGQEDRAVGPRRDPAVALQARGCIVPG